MEKNKIKAKATTNKYIELFKQFIKYKKHLLKINKNKEVESIIKKIYEGINIINSNSEKQNYSKQINKNYLYIIKGSINIIEDFWKKKCIKKPKIINNSKNFQLLNNNNYRTYQKEFYKSDFPFLNSFRKINNSEELSQHHKSRLNLTEIARSEDYLSSIINKILKKEKEKKQSDKKSIKHPLIVSIDLTNDDKTNDNNNIIKKNILNIKSCIIKANKRVKHLSNYCNYLEEIKKGIKSNKSKLKSPPNKRNKNHSINKISYKKSEFIKKELKSKSNKNEIKQIKLKSNDILFKTSSDKQIKKKNGFINKKNEEIKKEEEKEIKNIIIQKSANDFKKCKEIKNGIKDFTTCPAKLLPFALPYSVANAYLASPVLAELEDNLLTPYGLRMLSPCHPNYSQETGYVVPQYSGFLAELYLRIYGANGIDKAEKLYLNFDPCNGYNGNLICEKYDGTPPYTPDGAVIDSVAVAEIVRIKALIDKYKKTVIIK